MIRPRNQESCLDEGCVFVFLLLFMALSLAQAGEIHGRVLNQDGGAVSPPQACAVAL